MSRELFRVITIAAPKDAREATDRFARANAERRAVESALAEMNAEVSLLNKRLADMSDAPRHERQDVRAQRFNVEDRRLRTRRRMAWLVAEIEAVRGMVEAPDVVEVREVERARQNIADLFDRLDSGEAK